MRPDGGGADNAAEGLVIPSSGELFLIERMIGDSVGLQIIGHLLFGPKNQGIYLQDILTLIRPSATESLADANVVVASATFSLKGEGRALPSPFRERVERSPG